MKRSDFDYQLPAELVAQYPLPERSASRLLCLDGSNGTVVHRRFTDILDVLDPKDLLVFNDTRVIPARLCGEKATGGRLEILIERITGNHSAVAHIRCSKSPRAGTRVFLSQACGAAPGDLTLLVTGREGDLFCLSSEESGLAIAEVLQTLGHMPLPPYIQREDEAADQSRYQTVYAERDGAVAAPTAGLHFSEALLEQIDNRGIERVAVTLHVGAGTFQPVRTDEIEDHRMHRE